jgi:hypothetical protein
VPLVVEPDGPQPGVEGDALEGPGQVARLDGLPERQVQAEGQVRKGRGEPLRGDSLPRAAMRTGTPDNARCPIW